jgi:hypothetical protein
MLPQAAQACHGVCPAALAASLSPGCARRRSAGLPLTRARPLRLPGAPSLPPPLPPQACIPHKGGKGCTKKYMQSGAAEVSCKDGAISVNFTTTSGVAMLGQKDVKVSCDSEFSSPSTCAMGTPKGLVQVATESPNEVALKSPEWNDQCVCANGRRPIILIDVPEVIVGEACQKKKPKRRQR